MDKRVHTFVPVVISPFVTTVMGKSMPSGREKKKKGGGRIEGATAKDLHPEWMYLEIRYG